MPMFEERERAFEAKYAHDEEFRFLVAARRDKLLAGWVADRLALGNRERAALTRAVLALPDGPGHDALLTRHLEGALLDQGVVAGDAEVTGLLAECAAQAKRQLLGKPPPKAVSRAARDEAPGLPVGSAGPASPRARHRPRPRPAPRRPCPVTLPAACAAPSRTSP